jgi:diketogulonate reductase-like aldo/keto reductase
MDKLAKIPSVVFHTGRSIPILGYGTYQLAGNDCVHGTKHALKLGYRHIDTASFYANEAEIRKAVAESGLDRKSLYITSKLQPSQQGFDKAINACNEILKKLGTDYLDLLLIHWPGTSTYGAKEKGNADLRLQTWKAMIQLRSQGKVLDIGVSNFLVHHLGI